MFMVMLFRRACQTGSDTLHDRQQFVPRGMRRSDDGLAMCGLDPIWIADIRNRR
jgi:hypothetical protein